MLVPFFCTKGVSKPLSPQTWVLAAFLGASAATPAHQMLSTQESIWDIPLPPAELSILAQGVALRDAGVCPPFSHCIPPLSQGHRLPNPQVGH